MKKFCHFEVFSFGKYFRDLGTDSQFNRVDNIAEKGFDFSFDQFYAMLKYNGIMIRPERAKIMMEVVKSNYCASYVDPYLKQWVVIFKISE